MKKLSFLIVIVCLITGQSVNAQFEKGKIMAGVTSAISSGCGDYGTSLLSFGVMTIKYKSSSGESSEGDKGFVFNLMPRVGYFIIDNLVVGADLLVGYYSMKDDEGDKWTETTLGIGPFVRYYYPLEKIYPFVEANLAFGTFREKEDSYDWKEGLFMYGFGVGASLPLGEKVMLDSMLGYGSQTYKDEDDFKYIYGNFGLRVGFIVLF
ncbi:MAG: outer membrane beta-barrel protein [Bacteroidales bacterium]|nr:outer membrane beta-barrel protein [Bacteroidales bacterium]